MSLNRHWSPHFCILLLNEWLQLVAQIIKYLLSIVKIIVPVTRTKAINTTSPYHVDDLKNINTFLLCIPNKKKNSSVRQHGKPDCSLLSGIMLLLDTVLLLSLKLSLVLVHKMSLTISDSCCMCDGISLHCNTLVKLKQDSYNCGFLYNSIYGGAYKQ